MGSDIKKGKVALTFLDGLMNAEMYIEVLKNNLINPADNLYGKCKWRFQQDNAPCHKAYKVKRWIEDQGIRMLDHPPQSPDLNPIEFIWAIIKNEVEKKSPKTKIELRCCIELCWENLKNEVVVNCIDHLSKTIEKIIQVNGNFIKD